MRPSHGGLAFLALTGGAMLIVAGSRSGVPLALAAIGICYALLWGLVQAVPAIAEGLGPEQPPFIKRDSPDDDPVAPSGRPVHPRAALRVGTPVLVPIHSRPGQWLRARVVSVDAYGWVRVSYPGWGPEWQEIHHRGCLQQDPNSLIAGPDDGRIRPDIRGLRPHPDGP